MPIASSEAPAIAFPVIYGVTRLEPRILWALSSTDTTSDLVQEPLYAVNFYPYTQAGVDPIFAFTAERETVVCRVPKDSDEVIEVIRWFEDEDTDAYLNNVTWSIDATTGDPLVCVTGDKPAKIFVLNVNSGALVKSLIKTLIGHGGRINGFATSPLSPHIIASGSEDHTVRLWDLRVADENKACKVLLAGAGHRLEVKTIAFHRNGRYLLSGGLDSCINLWILPDLSGAESAEDEEELFMDSGVQLIHYPHFSSFEIHGDHIDCVNFYGDLVLSKSYREDFILMTRLTGFSSKTPLPPLSAAPTTSPTESRTRSAWCEDSKDAFQVLMRFNMPNCNYAWTHFSLYHTPRSHPILIVGSNNLWLSMWDLQALEDGVLGTIDLQEIASASKKTKLPITGDAKSGAVTSESWPGPFEPLLPHNAIRIPNLGNVAGPQTVRDFAFSQGGEWCVVVGDEGLICVLRWEQQMMKLEAMHAS